MSVDRHFLKNAIKNFMQSERDNINFDVDNILLLLEEAKANLSVQPSLLEIRSPCHVVGPLHGQIQDLRRIFYICGWPATTKFLFLGDYVGRGQQSIETMCSLLAFRLLYPDRVFLLRGNHEQASTSKQCGFHADMLARWGTEGLGNKVITKFYEVFAYIPLAATISEKILCMHGVLSPSLTSLDDIRHISRPINCPSGLASDLVWSDALAGVEGISPNRDRACGYFYGESEVEGRLRTMGLSKIIRASHCTQFGYETRAGGALITVFSATRHDTRLYNWGAIVAIRKNMIIEFIQIKPHDFDEPFGEADEEETKDVPEAHIRTEDTPSSPQ